MSASRSLLSLRNVLLVDAITCAAMGALLIGGSAAIGHLTQIPPALLFYAGLGLLPVAVFMGLVALRPVIPAAGVRLIVAGNILWVAGSLLLLGAGLITPNVLGLGFIVGQAAVVAVLARLEHGALHEMIVSTPAG